MALVPLVNIDNAGQYGIVTDIPPYQLPPNAWSGGNNVRVRNSGIKKCAGFEEVFASCPVPPHHIFPVADGTSVYWVALGEEKAYVFKNQGGGWTNITRQTTGADVNYTTSEEEGWSHTIIGGVPVMTNFRDPPQFWATAGGVYATATKLVELSNWEASADLCKSIKSFKTFLIALNMDRSTVPYPKLVKWSNEAASHAPPTSWDEADATKDAGEYELADTPGDIIDGLQLGESFMIYKDDAIYIMNYIGTPFIFSFRLLSPTVGILSKNCVSEFSGGHFFFGKTNIYLNNGQTISPLLTDRMRREVFENLDGDNFKRSFTVADYNRNEMLACYPAGGYTYPNRAVIWNWNTNTLTIRDLPNPSSMGFGVAFVSTTSDAWGAETTLNGTITAGSPASGASLTVTATGASTGKPAFPTSGTVVVDEEQITYTGTTSTTLTGITRGANSTSADGHTSGVVVSEFSTGWDAAARVWGSLTFERGAENLLFCVPGTSTGVISAATQANPVRITSTAHNLSNGDKIIIDNVAGMTEINAPAGSAYPAAGVLYAKIDATNPATEFTLYTDAALSASLNGTGFSAYSGSGGNIYKQRIFKDNTGNTEDGATMNSYISRTGIALTQDGSYDQSRVKYIRAVWPRMEVSGSNGEVNIYVAKQMFPEEAVTWAGPYTFNPNEESKVSCTVTGRYYGIKIESDTDVDWNLSGVGFEIEDAGHR